MNKQSKTILEKAQVLTDARALGLLAFGVVAVLVTWSGIKVVQTNYELEKKIAVAKQRNAIEQLANENLKLKNKYYESNQYLELSARRQFGKAAAGERLYIVPESVALAKTVGPAEPVTESSEVKVESKKPRYQQNFDDWMEFLFSTDPQRG